MRGRASTTNGTLDTTFLLRLKSNHRVFEIVSGSLYKIDANSGAGNISGGN
jgi:hypothetical protein